MFLLARPPQELPLEAPLNASAAPQGLAPLRDPLRAVTQSTRVVGEGGGTEQRGPQLLALLPGEHKGFLLRSSTRFFLEQMLEPASLLLSLCPAVPLSCCC